MITAAADGSSLSNPGPSGWAWFIDDARWASGGWPRGTNNMGELMAVLDLLRQTPDEELLILCDSQYVINSVTKWMPGWKRKGWRKADGKPVLNVDLLKGIDQALIGRRVRFEWVKGHAGHPLNEAADERARAAASAFQQGREPDPGPGFAGAGTSGSLPIPEPTDGVAQLPLDIPSDEDTVVALERELLSDAVRNNPRRVDQLLHPDFVELGASGRTRTRTELLASLAPLNRPVRSDVIAVDRIGPDAILLLWKSVSPDRSALRSSLWLRSRGQWRLRFHQGTPTA